MYTIEIDGRAIAVISGDEATARDLFTCDGFKEDIQAMTSGGKPLWNGTSPLTVRAASEDEIEEFEEALGEDDGSGDFADDPRHQATDTEDEEDDEADIVFLVDLDDEDDHLDA